MSTCSNKSLKNSDPDLIRFASDSFFVCLHLNEVTSDMMCNWRTWAQNGGLLCVCVCERLAPFIVDYVTQMPQRSEIVLAYVTPVNIATAVPHFGRSDIRTHAET